MTQDGQRRTRKPLLVNLIWAAAMVTLFSVVYVLSYAPAYRWTYGSDPGYFVGPGDQPTTSVFRPVEWLTDKTSLQGVLFEWADLWRVGDKMRLDSDIRCGYFSFADPDPPPI